MSNLLCQVVGMNGFRTLLKTVSPDITVCVRGRHAVGKSEGVYQAASELRCETYRDPQTCVNMVEALGGSVRVSKNGEKAEWVTKWNYDFGVPVVERRLSQMTEGDIIGMPELHNVRAGEQSWRSTAFRPCDWLIQACQFPVMLFLDERNRALEGVKQAVFQLADSKAFYGHVMHDETRIVVAENVGDQYQVEQSDPAEVSRWVTVELEPDVEEWLAWADGKCHPATIEFIRSNHSCLEHKGVFEANKKYPDRRSWYHLDKECQRLEIFTADNPNENQVLYILAGAFLGPEIGVKFNQFIVDRDREVKAMDIITNWAKAKKRIAGKDGLVSNPQYIEATAKVGDWCKEKTNILTDKQARQVALYMADCPAEARMSAWTAIQANSSNLFIIHKFTRQLIVVTASGGDTDKVKIPTVAALNKLAADKKAASEAKKTEGKKRGRK